MSNESLQYLFLHYGPGGNSGLERLRLEEYRSTVDFWDQPTNVSSFDELVRHCVERFKSGNYKGIIGHSFGCDLALRVGRQAGHSVELSLISPLRDIPTAFINLAYNLSKADVSGDRVLQLTEAAQKMRAMPNWQPGRNLSPDELNQFVQLVMALAADPNYFRGFWFTPEKLAAFESELPTLPPLAQSCWENVMIDFLMNHQSPPAPVNARVFVGTKDPYFGLIRDEKKYWENLGSQFFSVEKSGHYPHLESNVFEMLLKRT